MRRIVREQVEGAIDQLEGRGDDDRDEAVHDARKRLKKSRSALRLVRYDLGNDVRRRENVVMRDAARRLAGVRDAHVLVETLDALAEPRDGAAPAPEAVGRLRELLVSRREELRASAGQQEQGQAAATAALRELVARIDHWPLRDESFAAARKGLERIHRRGGQGMATAIERGAAASWHEWRKRVKDLWYCARILKPIAPSGLDGTVEEADRLSDVLGEHNDLAVLDGALDEHAAALDPGQVELLRAAIGRRRDELRLEALPLGQRLYAEKPGAFVRRVAHYWDAQAAQAAARAHWIAPEVAARIRGLLAEKESAEGAEGRRITAELRELGFRVTDFSDHVPRRRGGFAVSDFDELLGRGVIRLGEPPAPRSIPAAGPHQPSAGGSSDGTPDREREAEPSGTEIVRRTVRLAATTARWARRSLPI